MTWFNEFIESGAYLAHVAAICYALGLITRDQVLLRLLIFAGTVFYIAYYYIAPAQPLWDAIAWSVVLGACNLYVMIQIALERTTFSMSNAEKSLYQKFDKMSPGEFRRLIRIADWQQGDGKTNLTIENEVCEHLYYVASGAVGVEKKGHTFTVDDGGFIGEVGYLLNSKASGTTVAFPESTYLKWDGKALAALEQRYPGIRVALRDLMNVDMAGKVALSMGSNEITIARSPVTIP